MNSKNKGNTFERKIANLLSDRFKEKTGLEKSFTRNQDSGSFYGRTNQKRVVSHGTENANFGDIIAPKKFSFTVECKHYKTAPSFSAMVEGKCKMIDDWIEQAEQDAKNSNREMSIIMKFNNVQETVVLKALFGTLKSAINYKEYFIVRLEDFLAQDDSFFFLS